MGLPSEQLADAIERLYAVLASGSTLESVEGCPHCVSSENQAQLHAAPLRELTGSHLARYAFKAMSTWGDVEHFKYFLPRLFELTFEDRDIELELLCNKLEYGDWKSWSEPERDVVEQALHATAEWLLSLPPEVSPSAINDRLRAIETTGLELRWCGGEPDELSPVSAKRRLAGLIGEMVREESERLSSVLVERVKDRRTAEILEQAFFEHGDPVFSEAVQDLEALLARLSAHW